MKKITIALLSLALAGMVTGCSQSSEAQMERTITINSNVQLESSLADSTLPIEHHSIPLPEGLSAEASYAGFLGQKFYLNSDDGIYLFDAESENYGKVMDGDFYEVSKNGKHALTSIEDVSYVIDLETGEKTKISATHLKEMVSFANDEGTEVFHIYEGDNEDFVFELINVENKAKKSWSTTDQLAQNNLMMAAKKADNGIYVTGENSDGAYGLYQILDGNEVKQVATFDNGLMVDSFDFLSSKSIIFSGSVNDQTGIYIKDLNNKEAKLLVAGGEDEEGKWTPSYKLSPDKKKILFDTPVQVGEEYKTNVYVAEIDGEQLTNTARLIENGDLYAVISLSGNWSADSKTTYIFTYNKEDFTVDTIEKFVIGDE
ncbi:hypothetical protein [Bacillus sp. FJAT-27251]|uniref:TolB family protein n=1 Tax=Bacillus sp. FJAT-27251 TaxID=1684142 RepID=UPI0006A76731|nr:hypothetical protein [Bacillus sp. FJAT-27251]